MRPEMRSGAEPRRRITREDVMTAAEVGDLLGIPTSTVYRLARKRHPAERAARPDGAVPARRRRGRAARGMTPAAGYSSPTSSQAARGVSAGGWRPAWSSRSLSPVTIPRVRAVIASATR